MRITSTMTANDSIFNIQQSQNRLYRTNEQLGTQNNINRPSDDPVNAGLLLNIGDKLKAGEQYLGNIQQSSLWQQITSTTLTSMAGFVDLARKQVATMSSGTTDASFRQNIVSQLQSLKQQLIDMGNVQLNDQYIFGGAKNNAPPFSATFPYYAGDDTGINIEIAKDITLQTNIPGNQLLTADPAASHPYGSTNILKTFDDLIAAVSANDVQGIQNGAQALEAGSKQITNAMGAVASKVARLDAITKMNQNAKTTLETIYGSTQNADNAKLGVQLNQQQLAYEATLSTTAKLSQLSILDYM